MPYSFNDRRQVEPPPVTGTISHGRARTIAETYHGGRQGTGLYALATAGTVAPYLDREIAETIQGATTRRAQNDLSKLHRYAAKSGPRGPVRGWSVLEDQKRQLGYQMPAETTGQLQQAERAAAPKPGYRMPTDATGKLQQAEQEITKRQRRSAR